jgi:hypothetical protein
VNENVAANTLVYTAAATDTADISAGVTFSLKAVDDFAAFSAGNERQVVLALGVRGPGPGAALRARYGLGWSGVQARHSR